MNPRSSKKILNTQKLLAPAALVILYIFFALFGKNFFSTYTAKTVLESAYFIGFMAFGVTFVIITGGIDLSIGTVMMCSAMVGGVAFSACGDGRCGLRCSWFRSPDAFSASPTAS